MQYAPRASSMHPRAARHCVLRPSGRDNIIAPFIGHVDRTISAPMLTTMNRTANDINDGKSFLNLLIRVHCCGVYILSLYACLCLGAYICTQIPATHFSAPRLSATLPIRDRRPRACLPTALKSKSFDICIHIYKYIYIRYCCYGDLRWTQAFLLDELHLKRITQLLQNISTMVHRQTFRNFNSVTSLYILFLLLMTLRFVFPTNLRRVYKPRKP